MQELLKMIKQYDIAMTYEDETAHAWLIEKIQEYADKKVKEKMKMCKHMEKAMKKINKKGCLLCMKGELKQL